MNLANNNVFSAEENSYDIVSDFQEQTKDGKYKAYGNVMINDENSFRAKSDTLIYEKDQKKLQLSGSVNLENYKTRDILIEKLSSDELILFIDKGTFKINSKNGNRVKTRIKF